MKYLNALKKAKAEGRQVVIPDIKRYSPKDGELLAGRDPADYALALIKAGAPALSVVTEETEFKGSLSMLQSVAEAAGRYNVPVLRKDFIHTREDLIQTKESGASAILLMCSCLKPEELKYLYGEALSLGLDPFVETHRAEDFALVHELGAELIGINNRDILKLERDNGDVGNTLGLLEYAPENAFLVTESSIKDPSEVRLAVNGLSLSGAGKRTRGADAALVGTAIAKAPEPDVFYRMLTRKTSLKVCGLMNKEDIALCVRCGVERIGIVTEYPLYVPWNVDAETAAELRKAVPEGFCPVMVTGGSPEKILSLSKLVKPGMVQLHYMETLEETACISRELKKQGIGVIKTVPMDTASRMKQFGTADLAKIVSSLCATDVSELLVDPRHGRDVARRDLHADEELFARIKALSDKPVILAGGITGDNIKEMLLRTGAEAVDIMNGSEDAPGKKSLEKVRKIADAV